jgi:YVTN family beta-propeller protein
MNCHTIKKLFRLGVIAPAALLAMLAVAQTQQHITPTPAFMNGAPASSATQLATGQYITPTVIPGSVQQALNPELPAYPNFVAGEAVKSQLSPDGTTLAIICAGQNSLDNAAGSLDAANSTQYIFLYNVAGANKAKPTLTQVIQQTNAHVGLVFSPDGNTLYAAGGNDDAVYVYNKSGGTTFITPGTQIALGHFPPGATGSARNKGIGLGVQPNASGLGISADGKTLVVANNYNDSISVIDTATKTVRYEYDLRPYNATPATGNGQPGGTYPFAVIVKSNGSGNGTTAYVSSDRDREIVVVDISSATSGNLVTRIPLDGNGLGMTLDASQSRVYVAQDNADQVAVIDTTTDTIIAKIDARAPAGVLTPGRRFAKTDGREKGDEDEQGEEAIGSDEDARGNDHDADRHHAGRYTGAATYTVTLSPDGKTLYAVNAGANSVAVIPLTGEDANTVRGLIPTTYEPHDITFSADGSWMYIVNGKNATGPNPLHLSSNTSHMTSITYPGGNVAAQNAANASNQYQFQLERASLVSAPVPTSAALRVLTAQVAKNNFYTAEPVEKDEAVMNFVRQKIKHVIYIVKENRTFDQILGDLANGARADSSLTQFGQPITPNFHQLATKFVTLDNFMDPGDGSMDGWSWSLQGRVTNTETITQQINYAFVNRGLSYESEGENRSVPVNWLTVAERDAASGPAGTTNYSAASASLPGGTANLLPGTGNHASSDAPFGIQQGYIFDAVLHAGGTVRNYGFLVNNIGSIGTIAAPVDDPFKAGIIQVGPLDPTLAPLTDVYFRGYDQNYPDLWRYNEWKREFDQFVASGNLPNLSLVRFSHDHMGSFSSALAGVNTPETQQADDDYAVGKLVEAVANSPYASSTLIIITEDDCQDGPDHVDSHRATAYVVGPYVKKGGVVSTRFGQVNALRTIEDILGAPHINLNTAFQRPMADLFDINSSGSWTYTAVASTILKTTTLNLAQAHGDGGVKFAAGPNIKPKHNAAYWTKVTAGFDFSQADQVPPVRFNKVLWAGLMGPKPYPAIKGQAAVTTDD